MIQQIKPAAAYKPAVGPKGQDLLNKILSSTGWMYEHKLDGSRYLAHFTEDNVTYTSRRISDVTGKFAQYTGGKLEHLNLPHDELIGTILDGELMSTSAAADKGGDYMVFDILFYKGKDLRNIPLIDRLPYRNVAIQKIKAKYQDARIQEVEYNLITDEATTRTEYENYVKSGGEGFVLKRIDAPYMTGKRSRDMWVKWKRESSWDVFIEGYKESDSDKYGPKGLDTFRHLFAYQYDTDGNKQLVSSIPATSWTDEEHIQMKQAGIASLDGRVCELGGMERASKGVKIRHPRFIKWRADKNPEDCIIGGGHD